MCFPSEGEKARENLMNLSEAYLCPVNCSFNFTIGLKFFKIKKKGGGIQLRCLANKANIFIINASKYTNLQMTNQQASSGLSKFQICLPTL